MSIGGRDNPESGYALAYREALRGLDDQDQFVVDLRARAGTLIAAAAVTTSFFGGQLLSLYDLGLAGWVAIACFVLVGFVVLRILWPHRDWEFSMAPSEFIAQYLEPESGEPFELYRIERDLALHMGVSTDLNREQLRKLMSAFRLGVLLFVVEVLAWVVALAGTG